MSEQRFKLYVGENLNAAQLEMLTEIYDRLTVEKLAKFISFEECLNLKQVNGFVFVFAEFTGAAFNYLKSLNAR
jgi:hypothetical protein